MIVSLLLPVAYSTTALAARALRRAQAPLLNVGASDAARFAAGDRAEKGAHIIRQRGVGKARFANAGMDDPRLLGANLDLPPFGGAHRLADIRRHRA